MARRAVIEGSAALARQEPRFAPIVDALGPADLRRGRPRRTHFAELARAICYQQLAGAAARTIHGRFEAALGGRRPLRACSRHRETMRARGPLRQQAGIDPRPRRKGASRARSCSTASARLSDDEIVGALVHVRGIGRWTAEMFLMFQLGRPDVWPVDDLGVRKGYGILHDLPAPPAAKVLEPLGEPFGPTGRSRRGTAGAPRRRSVLRRAARSHRVHAHRRRVLGERREPEAGARASTATGSSTGHGSS